MNKKLRSFSVALLLSALGASTAAAQFLNSASLQISTNPSSPEYPFYITAATSNNAGYKSYFADKDGRVTTDISKRGRFALFAANDTAAYYLYSIDYNQWIYPANSESPVEGRHMWLFSANKADAKPWYIGRRGNVNENLFDVSPNETEFKKSNGLSWNWYGGAAYQGNSRVGLYQKGAAWSFISTNIVDPIDGQAYFIHVVNETAGVMKKQYFYNNNGTLAIAADSLSDNKYKFVARKNTDGSFSFQNVAGQYLGHKALSATPYNFGVYYNAFTDGAVSLHSPSVNRYFVLKQDGGFDQATSLYSPYTTNYSSDFKFERTSLPGITVSVNFPTANGVKLTLNGETYTSNFVANILPGETFAPKVIGTHPDYEFKGFKHNGVLITAENIQSYISSQTSNVTLDLDFQPTYFSDSFANAKWLRIVSANETNAYSWNIANASAPYARNTNTAIDEELFAFVGNSDSFKIYAKSLGDSQSFAALATPDNGTTTGFTATGSEWTIIPAPAGTKQGVQIAVKGNNNFVVNKYGGEGEQPLKFYNAGDNGGIWQLGTVIPVSVHTSMDASEATTPPPTARVTFSNVSATFNLTSGGNVTSTHYLPKSNSVINLTNDYRGYLLSATLDSKVLNSGDTLKLSTATPSLLEVVASIDANNKHQYLFRQDATGSYRIPAITTANDGRIIVATDHRIDHADVGYGRVNIKTRRSNVAGLAWDGKTWESDVFAALGTAIAADGTNNKWNYAFGDPAMVADRDSSHVLIMAVGGKVPIFSTTVDKPQHPVRNVSFDNGATWTVHEPLTEQFYSATLDPSKVLLGKAHGAFFGSGKIVQSKVYKKDNYYRLYACMLGAINGGRAGNFVTYSDDFGATWKPLGIANEAQMIGDEPKVEELPDGTIMLSARRPNGRVFNLFKFDQTTPNAIANAQGTWQTALSSNEAGDRSLTENDGPNGTNGEILVLRGVKKADGTSTDILLQSLPFGSGRANVGFFYKELDKAGKDMTVTDLCTGWRRGLQVSDRASAYSTMTILPDGKIGFFYEEVPTGYSMVYLPLTIEEITNNTYRSGFEGYNVQINGGDTQNLVLSYKGAHYAGTANAKDAGEIYLSAAPTAADFEVRDVLKRDAGTATISIVGNTITANVVPTAIRSTTTSTQTATSAYDLSGREVANPVKGNLYIQSGKRFFAK